MSVTSVSKEAILKRVLCIHYVVQFQKDKLNNILAQIESRRKVNVISPAYAKKLGF